VAAEDRRRLDKWIWYARLAKTRTLAQRLITSGHVRINGAKTLSASHSLRAGDVLTVALESGVRVLKVAGLGDRRGPAPEAMLLYEDITPPSPPGSKRDSRPGARPTKRDRRRLLAYRDGPGGDDFSPGDDG
jgi:ribosome-associated heat shock protein Hsp15